MLLNMKHYLTHVRINGLGHDLGATCALSQQKQLRLLAKYKVAKFTVDDE